MPSLPSSSAGLPVTHRPSASAKGGHSGAVRPSPTAATPTGPLSSRPLRVGGRPPAPKQRQAVARRWTLLLVILLGLGALMLLISQRANQMYAAQYYASTTSTLTQLLQQVSQENQQHENNRGENLPPQLRAGGSFQNPDEPRRILQSIPPASPSGAVAAPAPLFEVKPEQYTFHAEDPLGHTMAAAYQKRPRVHLPFRPTSQYLGVLLDAGRHYFPVFWIERLLDHLADMNYNFLHFRLTDDQTFNVLLDHFPSLAYPTATANNVARAVYTPDELRHLQRYARERNITIMPEINVPGHGGSWAGAMPNIVVHCPQFICDKGYGLPLNVTHPQFLSMLTTVLQEILDIFDQPPFLHLGGDEVNMADPCFREVHSSVFDYPAFELQLKQVLAHLKYPESQVVRWEMTGQKSLTRAGEIEHFWESHPGVRHEARGPFFISTWLYFDTNGDQTAADVYDKTREYFRLRHGKFPVAIIAGTFELSTEFWFDRNILGRLLAVAMGASQELQSLDQMAPGMTKRMEIIKKYQEYCDLLQLGSKVCGAQAGGPNIPTADYHAKWRQGWDLWKIDICRRMTENKGLVHFQPYEPHRRSSVPAANEYFWKNYPVVPTAQLTTSSSSTNSGSSYSLTGQAHAVPYTGVLLDVTSSLVQVSRLKEIVQVYVAKLGFNLVQLPLVTNHGFVYTSPVHHSLSYSILSGSQNPPYGLERDLQPLIEMASSVGVQIMPQVSISTDAAGLFKTGFPMNCPRHFCDGRGLPNDVTEPTLLPVVMAVVAELYKTFSSDLIHLGSDERMAAQDCLDEVQASKPGDTATTAAVSFDAFELKMTELLQLLKIPPSKVLRWENTERQQYPNRAGNMTQYRPGMQNVRSGETFFGTVDILKGDGWSIYQQTTTLVQLKATGVVAQIRTLPPERWTQFHIPQRLLAFALGVSSLPVATSVADFTTAYDKACRELGWQVDGQCQPPVALAEEVDYVADSTEFVEQHCALRTVQQQNRVAKEVTPYYEMSSVTQTS